MELSEAIMIRPDNISARENPLHTKVIDKPAIQYSETYSTNEWPDCSLVLLLSKCKIG